MVIVDENKVVEIHVQEAQDLTRAHLGHLLEKQRHITRLETALRMIRQHVNEEVYEEILKKAA